MALTRKIKLLSFMLFCSLLAHAESDVNFGFQSSNRDPNIWWDTGGTSNGENLYITGVFNSVGGFTCLSCQFVMDFGTLQQSTSTSWIFNPGSLFKVYGGVDLMNSGDSETSGNIPDVLQDGSSPQLATGSFSGTPTLNLISYNPSLKESILRFDAELNGTLLPQLADAFGFVGSGLGNVFLSFTVPDPIIGGESFPIMGGQSFQGDTLLAGQLTFNGLPQTPEVSSGLLLFLAAPLLYIGARRRNRAG